MEKNANKLEVIIKPMLKTDIEAVLKIEEFAYGDHHWSKDSFYGELSNNLAHYYSAFNADDELIGYAGSWRVIDEAHITTLAVKPEYLRKKIGEALLQTIIDDCYKNEIKYITLEVRVSNSAAIGLYEKYGFKSLGVRKGYYQNNNEDALIMWTENIFWDKFKLLYQQNVEKLKDLISIR